jgi:DNA-binding response OmpR family regulator
MITGRILVVDDDIAFAEALEIYLSDQGFTVATSHSGREAMRKARKQRFDAAIIDLHLPDATGVEVVTRIRRAQPGLPVVLISSDDELKSLPRRLLARSLVFMSKPLSPKELVERIQQIRGGAAPANACSLAAP